MVVSIVISLRLYHQHNPASFFCEHFGKAANRCIHLIARHRLPVFSLVQPLAIDGIGNLVGSHTAISLHHHIYYGFFYLHIDVIYLVAPPLPNGKSLTSIYSKHITYMSCSYCANFPVLSTTFLSLSLFVSIESSMSFRNLIVKFNFKIVKCHHLMCYHCFI